MSYRVYRRIQVGKKEYVMEEISKEVLKGRNV